MEKVGRKPFGYYTDEQRIIQLIKLKARVRRGGFKPTLSMVTREINAEGLRTRTGKLWSAQGIKNVLSRSAEVDKTKERRRKKTQLESGDFLTLQQVWSALEILTGDDDMIFRLLIGSGLRASELCDLQVRDLGVYGGKSQIDVRRGKGAKARSVFIDPELAIRIRYYLTDKHGHSGQKQWFIRNSRGEKLTYDALYYRVKKIGRQIGIIGLRPHALRHTFATLLYDYQKDLFFVQEQLGHASSDTTKIYAKTLNEAKKQQLQGFADRLYSTAEAGLLPENTSKLKKSTQNQTRALVTNGL